MIVHGYEEWGLEVLGRLNGMLGIAIWDSAVRRLVLARDPFGVKPLHYWHDGRELVFGSEVRCLPPLPYDAVELDCLSFSLTRRASCDDADAATVVGD